MMARWYVVSLKMVEESIMVAIYGDLGVFCWTFLFSILYLFPIYQRVRKGWEIIWQVACLVGKEQRDGRLSVSIWVYFGGELYMTLCIRVYSSVYTTLLHAGCICVFYVAVGCICICVYHTTACLVYQSRGMGLSHQLLSLILENTSEDSVITQDLVRSWSFCWIVS